VSAQDDDEDIFLDGDRDRQIPNVSEMFGVIDDRDFGPQWDPLHSRRHVMRQARYALNYLALMDAQMPPEGPFDVALTNGLLAVVGVSDPTQILAGKLTLPASALLSHIEHEQAVAKANMAEPLAVDVGVLRDGLEVTQPLRHGRADDEWIALTARHVEALRALDDLEGLRVLPFAEGIVAEKSKQADVADRLMVELYRARVDEHPSRSVSGLDEYLNMPYPENCVSCGRETFVADGLGEADQFSGLCIVCGFVRADGEAEEMYLAHEFARKWDKD
jgi:hypothetical protein